MKSIEITKQELETTEKEVARVFKISKKDLYSVSRKAELVQARVFAWRMLRFKYGWSTIKIGDTFGKDHSNIVKMTKRPELSPTKNDR